MARKAKKVQKRAPWTAQDEDRLIENVKKNVTNLSKAFDKTAKEIQRSPKAIAAHWYTHTSRDQHHVLFLTVSGQHVAFNRKNGKGQQSSLPLYKRILALFGVSM